MTDPKDELSDLFVTGGGGPSALEEGTGVGLDNPTLAPPPLVTPEPLPAPDIAPEIQELKEFGERLPIGTPDIAPRVLYTIRIEGKLDEPYRTRLLDIVAKAETGLREFDLEPQLELGRLLLPRVSEYVGVLLAQALRDANVLVEMIPAADDPDLLRPSLSNAVQASDSISAESHSEAKSLPVYPGAGPQGLGYWKTLDVISASTSLSSLAVEPAQSAEYQHALEELLRELRHKAWHRGAEAILHLAISLSPLQNPSQYKLSILGTAAKSR